MRTLEANGIYINQYQQGAFCSSLVPCFIPFGAWQEQAVNDEWKRWLGRWK